MKEKHTTRTCFQDTGNGKPLLHHMRKQIAYRNRQTRKIISRIIPRCVLFYLYIKVNHNLLFLMPSQYKFVFIMVSCQCNFDEI